MGLLDWLFGRRRPVAPRRMPVHGMPAARSMPAPRVPVRQFETRVAGVTFRNPDGVWRQILVAGSRPGDRLSLRREPDNPHDPDAVAVWSERLGAQLGYFPAHVAEELSHQMLDQPADAVVTEILGGAGDDRPVAMLIRVRLY